MISGYVSALKPEGREVLESQIDGLLLSGVDRENVFQDFVSSRREARPGLTACLQYLTKGDVLIVWKLEYLESGLHRLVETVHGLARRDVGLKILSGRCAGINTTKSNGKVLLDIFAALAEVAREAVSKIELADSDTTSFYDRRKGRKYSLSEAQIKIVQSALTNKNTNVSELCNELKITRQTLYRYFAPNGMLRPYGEYVLTRIGRHQAGRSNNGAG